MNDIKITSDNSVNDNIFNRLIDTNIPDISLPNQDGNLLKLKRSETFRLVIYFYSLTGNPKTKLPNNWNKISGASGCTLLNCIYRDNYEKIIQLNAIPLGVSTQSVEYIKEMTNRLNIQYDILSDVNFKFATKLSLPTFSINNQIFQKKLTIIVENFTIKKIFYPIFSPYKHINEIMFWLRKN